MKSEGRRNGCFGYSINLIQILRIK